jgi:hypothetical protein
VAPLVIVGSEFLALILSGGAAAMLAAIVQAYRSLRDGSRAEDRDAFAEIEESRKSEARRRKNAESERDYWRRRAATLEFAYISHVGPEKLPKFDPEPQFPEERDRKPEEETTT